MAMAEHGSDFAFTKDTPYLALTGELWGVFCEDFEENWSRYNGTILYLYPPYPKDRGMLWFNVEAARRPQWC